MIDVEIKKQSGSDIKVGGYWLNMCNRANEDMRIIHKGKKMIVKLQDFKTKFIKGAVLFKARYGKKDYYVYSINWNPTK